MGARIVRQGTLLVIVVVSVAVGLETAGRWVDVACWLSAFLAATLLLTEDGR